jgi:hypothetical protein
LFTSAFNCVLTPVDLERPCCTRIARNDENTKLIGKPKCSHFAFFLSNPLFHSLSLTLSLSLTTRLLAKLELALLSSSLSLVSQFIFAQRDPFFELIRVQGHLPDHFSCAVHLAFSFSLSLSLVSTQARPLSNSSLLTDSLSLSLSLTLSSPMLNSFARCSCVQIGQINWATICFLFCATRPISSVVIHPGSSDPTETIFTLRHWPVRSSIHVYFNITSVFFTFLARLLDHRRFVRPVRSTLFG